MNRFPQVFQEVKSINLPFTGTLSLSDFVGSFTVVTNNRSGTNFATSNPPSDRLISGITPNGTRGTYSGDPKNLLTDDIGVALIDSHFNLIGVPGGPNTIEHSSQAGIQIVGPDMSNPDVNNGVDNRIQSNNLTDNQIGVFVNNASRNVIGGAGAGNVIVDDAPFNQQRIDQVGVYTFDRAATMNSISNNTITNMGGYGILLFNTPPNSNNVVMTGPNANRVSGSGSADFRVFNGAVQFRTTPVSSSTGTAKGQHRQHGKPHPKGPARGGKKQTKATQSSHSVSALTRRLH